MSTKIYIPPRCGRHDTFSTLYLDGTSSSDCKEFSKDIIIGSIYPNANISQCAHLAIYLLDNIDALALGVGSPLSSLSLPYVCDKGNGLLGITWLLLYYRKNEDVWTMQMHTV